MSKKAKTKRLSNKEVKEKYTNEQKQELIEAAEEIGRACRWIFEDIRDQTLGAGADDNPMLHAAMLVSEYSNILDRMKSYFSPVGYPHNPIYEYTCEELRELATYLKDEYEDTEYDEYAKGNLDRLVKDVDKTKALLTRLNVEIKGGAHKRK